METVIAIGKNVTTLSAEHLNTAAKVALWKAAQNYCTECGIDFDTVVFRGECIHGYREPIDNVMFADFS